MVNVRAMLKGEFEFIEKIDSGKKTIKFSSNLTEFITFKFYDDFKEFLFSQKFYIV